MAKSTGYGSDAIQNLSPRDQVRLRPSTYIGGTGTSSLVHLVDEVLANSADEAIAGFCRNVAVTIHKDKRVTIADDGRGVPIGATKLADGRTVPTVQAAFTEMFTGGKYAAGKEGADEGAYSGGSGGMNGMGAKAVVFVSTETSVDVRRDGQRYTQRYTNGAKGSKNDVLSIEKEKLEAYKEKDTGTSVTFRYDESIFDADAEIDGGRIRRKCYNLSRLVPGLKIVFIDERAKEKEVFYSEKGLVDFVKDLNDGESILFKDIVAIGIEKTVEDANGRPIGIRLDAAFQPIAAETGDERGLAFTNLVHNPDYGMHVSGFRKGLTRALNAYFKSQKLLKDADSGFEGSDVTGSGLGFVVSLRAPANAVQYESQTKKCLTSAWAEPAVANITADAVRDWLTDHPNQAKQWYAYLAEVRKAREAMIAERKAVKAKVGGGAGLDPLISKIARETARNPERAEIYYVEGDSAGGNAKKARDRAFQAILPFRGKMLNVMGALSGKRDAAKRLEARKKVIENEDVRRIATALETGMGSHFDIERLRYHKVILMADADADGGHIVMLWIGAFWAMFPEIVKRGHLYIAIPPLFSVYDLKAKKREYFYDAREMAAWSKGRSKDSFNVTRFKGLGEMQAEDLERTAMNPATRRLRQITVEDVVETKLIVDTLMGDRDASGRRQFMDEHCRDRNTREDVEVDL
jgi:DNA gyrase subunit B